MNIPRALWALLMLPPGFVAAVKLAQSRSTDVTPAISSPSTTTPVAQTLPPSTIVLTETEELRLSLPHPGDSVALRAVLFLKNDSDGSATVTCVRVVLRDSIERATTIDALFNSRSCGATGAQPEVALPPWSVTPLTIHITPPSGAPPFAGFLVFSIRDSSSQKTHSVLRPLKITRSVPMRDSKYAELFVLGTLGLALLFSLIAAFTGETGSVVGGAPTWDPKTSWASNVGVAGGLITALVSASFLPDEPYYLSKSAYSILAGIFVTITGLAPIAYVFVAKLGEARTPRLAAVVIASAVTLWGALGQISIAWALFGELGPTRILPRLSVWTFQGLMIVLAVLLVGYGVRSIRELVNPPAAAGVQRYTLL